MHTTNWNRVRKRLQKSAILLILIVLILFTVADHLISTVTTLYTQVADLKGKLKDTNDKLLQSEKNLEENSTKIDKLNKTILAQKGDYQKLFKKNKNIRDEFFIERLARRIFDYYVTREPDRMISHLNPGNIIEYIRSSMLYEEIYSKKYPKYKLKYDWKIAMSMLRVEGKYDKFAGPSTAGALGAPQILEFEYYKDKKGKVHKINQLYNTLCELGYKKETYGKTIDFYLQTPKVQVDCFYFWYTRKLKDMHGSFIAAIVAYNGRQDFPEQSEYWFDYSKCRNTLQKEIEGAYSDANRF